MLNTWMLQNYGNELYIFVNCKSSVFYLSGYSDMSQKNKKDSPGKYVWHKPETNTILLLILC